MASFLAIFAILALGALTSEACNVPTGSCTPQKCSALGALEGIFTYAKAYPLRNLYGELLGSVQNPTKGINLEFFPEVRYKNVIAGASATSLVGCCNACAANPKCVYYQFFRSIDDASKVDGYFSLPPAKQTQCLLLGLAAGNKVNGLSAPNAPTHSQQLNINANLAKLNYVLSYVGGRCPAEIADDPHLIGGHGTPFDFNGKLNKAFCLTTDKHLHINVLLRGYEDARTNGATVQANGKALRSWIKEVGLLWVSPSDGKRHSLHLVARAGKQQERGDGFLTRISVDGQAATVPQVGETVHGEGGLALTLLAVEKTGPFDVDVFTLAIDGVAELELRMRVAHPALQSPEDAEAHFNLFLSDIKATSAIHGVLGQTYKDTQERAQKAVKYSELASLLNAPVAADGASGKGFLDGSVDDYITPDVLSPGCKFSSFAAAA